MCGNTAKRPVPSQVTCRRAISHSTRSGASHDTRERSGRNCGRRNPQTYASCPTNCLRMKDAITFLSDFRRPQNATVVSETQAVFVRPQGYVHGRE